MKTALGIVGFISCLLIILGSMFKLQQWPGGGPMVVLGVSLFAQIFTLLYFIYRIKNRKGSFDVLHAVILTFTMWCLSIGLMFKVQHWPGAGVLLVIGMTVLTVFCLPVFIVSFIKEERYKDGMNNLWLIMAIAAISLVMAMRASREVVSGFATNHQLIMQGNDMLNEVVMRSGQAVPPANSEKAKRIDLLSADIYQLLEDYKSHLIRQTDRLEPTEAIELSEVLSLDNYDVPTNILIGGDPGDPRTDEWSAVRLKDALATYANAMADESTAEENAAMIMALFNQEPIDIPRDGKRAWEIALFYHMPLGSVITSLGVMQNNVLTSQALLLNDLAQVKTDTADLQP